MSDSTSTPSHPAASPSPCGCATARPADGPAEAPIACDLSVFSAEERLRHRERGRRVFSALEQIDEEATGFTFGLRDFPALEEEVSLWIADERRCCPFFRFATSRSRQGRLVLRITGPGAAKEILRSGLEENGLVSSAERAR